MLQTNKCCRPIVTIFVIWAAYLALLGGLQTLGAGVGFRVWAVGEDRNWLYLLNAGSPVDVFKAFWDLDHRNPMAAFWWLLASPVIRFSDWGLHAISLIVSPLAAVVTFLTLDRLARGKARLFVLLTALLVLFWDLPARHDHVDRVMIIALVFTLLSIYFYTGFVDSGRRRYSALVFALLCYLVALATYTIQSGALIAIPFICFFRFNSDLRKRVIFSIVDVAFFAVVFVAYTKTWMHFAGPASGFSLSVGDIVSNAAVSIKAFVVPPYNKEMLQLARAEFLPGEFIYWVALSFILALVLLVVAVRTVSFEDVKFPVLWALLLLAAIAAPTVLVEAGNPTWGPGSRSIMVMQVWQPIFLLTVVGALGIGRLRKLMLSVAFLVFATAIIFSGFGFNHYQTQVTKYQRNLAMGLRALDEGQMSYKSYLVNIKNPVSPYVGTEPTLASYAPTILGRNETSLRLFVNYPSPIPSYDPIWKIRFTEAGVENARGFFDPAVMPYENVKIVYFDGNKVTVPSVVEQKDLEGLQVEWLRHEAISQ